MSFVTGLAHVGIRVHDLARSRAFYEVLGFEFIAGPLGPEPVAILRHPAGVEVNFILNAAAASGPNVLMDVKEKHAGYTHIALRVRDLAEAQASLERADHRISDGPITFPTGARAIFVRDPDGNVLELNQPPAEPVRMSLPPPISDA